MYGGKRRLKQASGRVHSPPSLNGDSGASAGRVSRRCTTDNGRDDILSSWRFSHTFSFFYPVLQIPG